MAPRTNRTFKPPFRVWISESNFKAVTRRSSGSFASMAICQPRHFVLTVLPKRA
jgi:hypothetical protein